MSFTLASIVITAALCYAIFQITMWHLRRRRLYKLASKFDGPSPLPFIGNAHLFIGNSEHLLSKIGELSNSYPSPSRLWLGPHLVCFTADPEQIKAICLDPKTLGKSHLFTDFTRPVIGTGVLTARVPKWKVHRKLIQPTFNAKILDSFGAVFAAQSKILTERMEQNLDGQEFEVFNLVSRCTLDMICEAAMGVKMEAQTNKSCYYVDAVQGVTAAVCTRIFHPWLSPDLIFHHTQIGRDYEKYVKYMHEFSSNVIQLKKKQLLEGNSQPGKSPAPRAAFLDYLMTLPNGCVSLSDVELREEVDTMVLAGNDTNAMTGSFVMLMLASHPDIQTYQELYEIYGDDDIEDHPIAPEDIPRMKYLERVIKETLRLFPVGPIIIRDVTDDLNLGEKTIPKGSSIANGILSLHRNEKYWQDPLKFDPDRFLPEEVAKRHPYAFMAFSGGPRNCLGYKYALVSLKTLVATVLRRFILKKDDIIPVKNIRLKMDLVLKPVDPIKIRIEGRNGTRFASLRQDIDSGFL